MRLRVATWNLENFDARSPTPLAERVSALRPTLLALQADVLCLQEVGSERSAAQAPRRLVQLDALVEDTPYAAFHRFAAGLPNGGLNDVHNLALLSRYPLLACQAVANELVPALQVRRQTARSAEPQPVAWDRPLLYAQVQLPEGAPLHVIVAHLRAPIAAPVEGQKLGPMHWRSTAGWAEGFFLANLKRTGQALEARLLVDRCFDDAPDARVLVAGDLNAELGETALRVLRAREEDTGAPELRARVLAALGERVPEARRFSLIHEGRPQLVDHLLASRALMQGEVAAWALNDGLQDEGARPPEAGFAGSFHAPLVAAFELA